MSKEVFFSIALMVSSAFFWSCGTKDVAEERHTPEFNMISSVKNHAFIASYDFMKLMDKSQVQSSEEMPMEMKFAMNMYLGKMLNSSNMGIKLEGNNHMVATIKENGTFDFGFLVAKIVDESKVKKGVKDFFKGKYSEENGIQFLEHKYSPTIAAWDSTHIIFIYTDKDDFDLKAKAKSILDARKIEGVDNNVLEDYLNRDDDMNALIYLDKWMRFIQSESKELDVQMDEDFMSLYNDSYMIASGNFLLGKIVFEMEMHADRLKDSKYNLLPGDPISKEFMSYLSPKTPIMFGVISMNMDALFEVALQNDDLQKEMNQGLIKIGWSEKEIKDILTGEFSASLVGIEMKSNPYYDLQASIIEDDFFADMEDNYIPNPVDIPMPIYVVTVGVNDGEKLKNLFLMLSGIEEKEGYMIGGDDSFIIFNNNKVILTSDEEIAVTLGSGKTLKEFTPSSEITSSIYGEVIPNLANLPQGFKDLIIANGGNESEGLLKFMNEFEKVTFSGSFDNMKMEIIMTDKNANSLEVISSKIVKQIIQNLSLFI